MAGPWLQIGAAVLITSGPFQGFEVTVDNLDASSDAVVVRLELFGRPLPLTFPLSTAGGHLAPFGDQPPIAQRPRANVQQRDLLSLCPEADATYRTDWWRSTTLGSVQFSRRGSDYRLVVRAHDLTWPCREGMVWSVREVPLTGSEWGAFSGLIEACRFWQLPYDDGRRVPRREKSWRWWLERYDGGRYHAVLRATAESRSSISACCDYLRGLARLET